MSRIARVTTGVAVLGLAGVVAAPAALAQTTDCAVYPDACVESQVVNDRPAPAVDSSTGNRVDSSTSNRDAGSPATLPFTGGEVLLIGLAGGGAVAAGAVLVVAARRRGVTAA